jgi:hypothetical protein
MIREDIEIEKISRCLSIMDKLQVDSRLRDIYFKLCVAYAIKYNLSALGEFLSLTKTNGEIQIK